MLGALLSKIGSAAKVAGKGVAKGAAKGINKHAMLMEKKKKLKKKVTGDVRRKALERAFANSGLSDEALENLLR